MSSELSPSLPVAPMVSGEATERATAAVVAAMSHELRTPLAAITGSLQLLGEMSLDREEQRLVRIARQSAETLTHLLDDVLELARVDAGAVELAAAEFEPARLLDSVVQLLVPRVTQQRVLLTTELDIALPKRLYMARDRLRQVLLNLASHAIRSKPGGEVAVRLSQGAVGHLRLEVSDNGPALPLVRQASVLAPRSRQQGGQASAMDGAGVGLALCQRLVEMLGGRMGMTSSAGVGTTFWAELPWQGASTGSPVVTPTLPKKRVLILVEGSLGKQVESQYTAWGMEVERVATATKAAAALEGGIGVPYDLVVFDLRLGRVPGGVPPTLLTEFRAAGVPVAALQDAFAMAIGSPRDHGADYLLSVPVLLDDLRQCLQAAEKAAPMASAERLVERRLRVLLADDSQSNRLVLAELLRRRGCEVDVATNGQEAVDSVLRALHDVVIMDIDMPVMDGVAALQAIRRLGGMQSRLPVVAMTAHAAPTARADFLAAGFDDYLAKPVDSGVLMETVARCATVLQSATTEAANISHIGPAEAGAWLAQHGERALETAALRRLAQEVGQERLPRMVRIFSEELERRAGLIRTALEQGDMAVLGRESHVLKGSAATFGAHELQRHASRLNDACRREARQDALECSGQLLAAVPRTLEALRAALQEVAL